LAIKLRSPKQVLDNLAQNVFGDSDGEMGDSLT